MQGSAPTGKHRSPWAAARSSARQTLTQTTEFCERDAPEMNARVVTPRTVLVAASRGAQVGNAQGTSPAVGIAVHLIANADMGFCEVVPATASTHVRCLARSVSRLDASNGRGQKQAARIRRARAYE